VRPWPPDARPALAPPGAPAWPSSAPIGSCYRDAYNPALHEAWNQRQRKPSEPDLRRNGSHPLADDRGSGSSTSAMFKAGAADVPWPC